MKKLKLNLIAIAALAIAAVTMSFEMTGIAETTWYYTDVENPGVFTDVDNWEKGTSTCGPLGIKPCQISVEASTKANLTPFFPA